MGLLDKIFRIFDRPQPPIFSQETVSSEAIGNVKEPSDSLRKLESLKGLLKDKCHDKFLFLDKVYSPSSRVPCVDFTNWIISRLEEEDTNAIKFLLREIIRGNPGVWVGASAGENNSTDSALEDVASWTDDSIDSVLSINFNEFLNIDKQAIKESQAIFIILSKNGAGREFWIFDNASLIADALCIYPLTLSEQSFASLIEKANKFIRSMKKEKIPAWEELKYYATKDINLSLSDDISNNEIAQILKKLAISSRFHFFDAVGYLNFDGKSVISLYESTFYQTRSFGIDIEDSAASLYHSGLFEKNSNYSLMINLLTKPEIISIAESAAVDIKKSWNKKKMLDSIFASDKGKKVLAEITDTKKVCYFKADYKEALISLNKHRHNIRKVTELLCFL